MASEMANSDDAKIASIIHGPFVWWLNLTFVFQVRVLPLTTHGPPTTLDIRISPACLHTALTDRQIYDKRLSVVPAGQHSVRLRIRGGHFRE